MKLRLMGVRLSDLRPRGSTRFSDLRIWAKADAPIEKPTEETPNSSDNHGKSCARCPICDRDIPEDAATINRHVDECLNERALRAEKAESRIILGAAAEPKANRQKKRSAMDLFLSRKK